jgi:hypothetical protein
MLHRFYASLRLHQAPPVTAHQMRQTSRLIDAIVAQARA